jgi:hypothetical protein
VRIVAELMDVIRDLCACSAAFSLLGEHARAAALIEQCAELLAHRARLVAGVSRDRGLAQPPPPHGSSRTGGLGWTN